MSNFYIGEWLCKVWQWVYDVIFISYKCLEHEPFMWTVLTVKQISVSRNWHKFMFSSLFVRQETNLYMPIAEPLAIFENFRFKNVLLVAWWDRWGDRTLFQSSSAEVEKLPLNGSKSFQIYRVDYACLHAAYYLGLFMCNLVQFSFVNLIMFNLVYSVYL